METLWLESRHWGTIACVVIALVLFAVLATIKLAQVLHPHLERFLSYSGPKKICAASLLVALVAWAGEKPPSAPAVKGVTLEPVEMTSTNATLRYSIDSENSNVATVSNRTVWIYHKTVDGMWRMVMELERQSGQNFQTTVNGFFPREDADWKIIVSGQESEDDE